MENDWEPMKKRNSCVMMERLWKDLGTIDHMLGKKRKGPQPIEGRILGGERETLQQCNITWKTFNTSLLGLLQ